jgi:hypothetical protein
LIKGGGSSSPSFVYTVRREDMCSGGEEKARNVNIKVNGKDVPLNRFATRIVGNTIWATIASLRLEEEPAKVEIEVSE